MSEGTFSYVMHIKKTSMKGISMDNIFIYLPDREKNTFCQITITPYLYVG